MKIHDLGHNLWSHNLALILLVMTLDPIVLEALILKILEQNGQSLP